VTPLGSVLLGLALVWVVTRARAALTVLRLPRLEDVGSGEDASVPSVTVVAAARDERDHAAQAVASWLRQDVPDLQVVFVDDRSRDGTLEEVRAAVGGDPRLLLVRLESRPAGWLGKCHALQEGARRAHGEYVLFTDADVTLHPGCLRRALAYCRRERVDHLALLPRVDCHGYFQAAFTAAFFQTFILSLIRGRPNRDDGRSALGVGAFGLVRREALERAGGFEPIRLQVGDDPALARLLVNAGFRHRVVTGHAWASLSWQRGLRGTIRGLEKNAFWALRFSTPLLLAFTALVATLLAPLLGCVADGPAGAAAFGLWWLGAAMPYHALARRTGSGLAALPAHPLSLMVLVLVAWNSAWATWRQGGVRWRDDFYPVDELRAALKPISWWRGRDATNRRREETALS
jgi:hypothetical protein